MRDTLGKKIRNSARNTEKNMGFLALICALETTAKKALTEGHKGNAPGFLDTGKTYKPQVSAPAAYYFFPCYVSARIRADAKKSGVFLIENSVPLPLVTSFPSTFFGPPIHL